VKVQALQSHEDAVLTEVFVRFLIDGTVVSGFALRGGLFKPKTFAGLFGAAPSVALATLTFAIWKEGTLYATVECRSMRSMMAGALALCLYSILISQLLSRFRMSALGATLISMPLWFITTFGLWRVLFR
jgi:hypothetical protein